MDRQLSLKLDVSPLTDAISALVERMDAQERRLEEYRKKTEEYHEFQETSQTLLQQYKGAWAKCQCSGPAHVLFRLAGLADWLTGGLTG